jgi:hypothetical protein
MDYSLAVSFVESIGDLHAYLQAKRQGERTTTQSNSEGFTLQILHDDEIDPALRANVVETANIGMCEQRDGSRLALKPLLQIGIRRKVT